MSTFGDRAFAALQYALPKRLLSALIYRLMRSEQPWLRKRIVSWFLRNYPVDMQDASEPDPHAYPSFNAFFTRALKPSARPLASEPSAFVSPVDGTVSHCGLIEGERVFQAKGRDYSLMELLGGLENAAAYRGGAFATLYLAPYNYHRIHMPFAGRVRETLYVAGELFSVNAATARAVPRLFARNERVVCEFHSSVTRPPFCFVMVFVGALFVGSIETTWCGEVNPLARRGRSTRITTGLGRDLAKGEEAGRFNMGSTVIILTPPGRVTWTSTLQPGVVVRMGEPIGRVT